MSSDLPPGFGFAESSYHAGIESPWTEPDAMPEDILAWARGDDLEHVAPRSCPVSPAAVLMAAGTVLLALLAVIAIAAGAFS